MWPHNFIQTSTFTDLVTYQKKEIICHKGRLGMGVGGKGVVGGRKGVGRNGVAGSLVVGHLHWWKDVALPYGMAETWSLTV